MYIYDNIYHDFIGKMDEQGCLHKLMTQYINLEGTFLPLLLLIIGICLLFVVILFGYFTIVCILSAWWNILLVLLILLAAIWCMIRRKKGRSIWQGIILIILALLLLLWFLLPCIIEHYKEFDEGAVDESETVSETSVIAPVKVSDDADKKKMQQEEKEKAEQAAKKRAKQAEIEKAAQAAREKEEKEKAEQAAKEKEERSCMKIKGNISSSGEKIFHVPSGDYYDITEAEDTFCTKSAARAAGYRESKR